MRAPRYKLCHYCGRNEHKLAVRLADGTVIGICPQCWHGKPGYGRGKGFGLFNAEQVLYDRRGRHLPIYLGVIDGENAYESEDD